MPDRNDADGTRSHADRNRRAGGNRRSGRKRRAGRDRTTEHVHGVSAARQRGTLSLEARMKDFVWRLSPRAMLVGSALFARGALDGSDADGTRDSVRRGLRLAALLAGRGRADEVRDVADLLAVAAARLERGDAAGADAVLGRVHRENEDLWRMLLTGLGEVVSPGP
jgi:hypothetical protein